MKIFQLKSQSCINNFINRSPINKFITEITSALDKIPENRNKCESENLIITTSTQIFLNVHYLNLTTI